jgi:hypothetical protein
VVVVVVVHCAVCCVVKERSVCIFFHQQGCYEYFLLVA